MAKTTITSRTFDTSNTSDINSDILDDIENFDINGFDTSKDIVPSSADFQFDKDGFLIDGTEVEPELTEEEQAAKAKKDRIEEERNRPTQIYRGAEANKPKLEAPRTHLMYEPTRY